MWRPCNLFLRCIEYMNHEMMASKNKLDPTISSSRVTINSQLLFDSQSMMISLVNYSFSPTKNVALDDTSSYGKGGLALFPSGYTSLRA